MYGRTDLALRLRTLQGNAWLHVSWHPVASRVCVGAEPPRGAIAEGFTLAEQLSDNLNGLVLVGVTMPQVRGCCWRFAWLSKEWASGRASCCHGALCWA